MRLRDRRRRALREQILLEHGFGAHGEDDQAREDDQDIPASEAVQGKRPPSPIEHAEYPDTPSPIECPEYPMQRTAMFRLQPLRCTRCTPN
jgi:hypothetical protein